MAKNFSQLKKFFKSTSMFNLTSSSDVLSLPSELTIQFSIFGSSLPLVRNKKISEVK